MAPKAPVTPEQLAAHLRVRRYGDFELTDAIRPAPHVPVRPREGFRTETYRDVNASLSVPVLAAAVSNEKLFEAFLDLLDPLGDVVDLVLETSHASEGATHRDLFREHIDLPVLQSCFLEFENLLLNDGCTGTAIISSTEPMEVQFDEHKLLVVYAHNLRPFARILRRHGVVEDAGLRLITEGEHLHSTAPGHAEEFERLCCRVGVAEPGERVSRE
jgi:hypothetical protein